MQAWCSGYASHEAVTAHLSGESPLISLWVKHATEDARVKQVGVELPERAVVG